MSTTNSTIANKLTELKNATDESINKRKKFDVTISDSFKEKLGTAADNYYETYLIQTLGDKVNPVIVNAKGKRGKEEKIRFNAMPMHHYNTLLAMAFAKGEKLYSELRKKTGGKKVDTTVLHEIPTIVPDNYNMEYERLSPLEYLTLSRQLFGGKNASLVKSLKKGEMGDLKLFAEKEHVWSKALIELRNYHAHIFHEAGPVSFKNLYGDEYKPENKLTEAEWKEARDFFEKRFNEVKEHKIKTLKKEFDTFDANNNKGNAKDDIEKVLATITNYKFEISGYVTREALLFIACMFLRKSDAEWFAKKWTGMKKAEGVYKSTSNFFTENAIRESKSQLRLDNDMFKFRQIIGILSTMPVLNNEGMKPFYDFIKTYNDGIAAESDKQYKKEEKDKLTAFIIPSRKSSNYTYWYMKYLDDNGLLNDFQVAYYKTIDDRGEFLKRHNITSIIEFKLKMKQAIGGEKKQLTAIYKEAKKNYLFKKPSANDYDNYCIKKLNVFIQYQFKNKEKDICVQVSLSPDFLMKWAFIHLENNEKGEKISSSLKLYLQNYYHRCMRGVFTNIVPHLAPEKIFPASLIDTVREQDKKIDREKLIRRITAKLEMLQRFTSENQSKRAPWKFASKRKIDIILEYVHQTYLDRAYNEKKSMDTIRHEGINDIEYQDIFEFIRYYGRYCQTDEFKKVFFDDKRTYFQPLLKAMKQIDSLENLFNVAITDYVNYLQTALSKVDSNLEKYANTFKVKGKSLDGKIKEHAPLFAVNHCVPHEIISLGNEFREYGDWKKGTQQKEWISDFAFIRNTLESKGGFSNTDYLMSEIMPLIPFPKNEKGTIQNNRTMFQTLWRNKTNELMLWKIAKYYWKKATGAEHTGTFEKLKINEIKKITRAYKNTNPYYKIFQDKLGLTIQGSDLNKRYTLRIKPKKLDDEYQYYEETHIKDYIEHHIKPETNNYICDFEEINKQIKDILTKYLDDIFLLLSTEKWIVRKNFDKYVTQLHESTTDRLPPYYITFQTSSPLSEDMFNMLTHNSDFTCKDLSDYRNDIMHQQLFKNKYKYNAIRKSMLQFCKTNKIL